MKIAVMGAGAVGCYYGGMLARAGRQVVLIARPQHVEAIRRDGLRLQTRQFDEHVGAPNLSATTNLAAMAGAELVLFCVKSADTESAGAAIRDHLDPGALVLTLQNGVDNAVRLRRVIPNEVAAVVVYVATEMAGPGHVLHHGRGDLAIEPSSASEAVARILTDAGLPTEVSADVRGALWGKLAINCAYNAFSAITQLPYGVLSAGDGVPAAMRDIVAECIAVAKADGVALDPGLNQAVERLAQAMPGQYSSTAQDLARGKRTEIDHLNGFVVSRGEALGVPTPANRLLTSLVKLIEGRVGQNAIGSPT